MEQQDRGSLEDLEDLLQSGKADVDDDGFAHDSNDDVFGGAFNADDLLNCSLSSGGGLDLSTSMNRTTVGNMSFSNSQGNLSTDEGGFGVFDCNLTPSRIPDLRRNREEEYSSSQLAETQDGTQAYLNNSSSHNNSINGREALPTQADRQRCPDMTLEVVRRTNSLTLGSFHGASTGTHSMSQSQHHLHEGSQRSLQQQQQQQQQLYDGDQSHLLPNNHPTTNGNSYDPTSGPRRSAPIRAFSDELSNDGRFIDDVLNQEGKSNFHQQLLLSQHSMLGDGCNSTYNRSSSQGNANSDQYNLGNSSNHLPFNNTAIMNGVPQQNNGGHRPSPTQSYSTNTQCFPGINLECARMNGGNMNAASNASMTRGISNSNNSCIDGGNARNGTMGSNGINVDFMHGLNVNVTDPKDMNLEEMKQELQQLQQMQQLQQQLQQQQGIMDNRSSNFQVQGGNINNFQMTQSTMPVPNSNFQMSSNMSFPPQDMSGNSFQMPNSFSQRPTMQQMLNGSTFQSNSNGGNANNGADTLLGTFPQGNAFAGMQCNVSIAHPAGASHCTPVKPQFPIVTTNPTSYVEAPLSPVAASLKAAPAPSSMNEVMEKLSESMRRSAMSRSVVKQLSGRNVMARPNPVMIMAQKQRGMVQRATSDRSLMTGDANSSRPIPVRRMSNTKHHIHQHLPSRSLHRHNSQQSLDGHSSHNTISLQMDGKNLGTL